MWDIYDAIPVRADRRFYMEGFAATFRNGTGYRRRGVKFGGPEIGAEELKQGLSFLFGGGAGITARGQDARLRPHRFGDTWLVPKN